MSRVAVGEARPTERPTVTARNNAATPLAELWRYREVLFAFVVRHVKVRYKQATIGVGWSILQPILASVLFAVFLGRFAHLASEGVPYVGCA